MFQFHYVIGRGGFGKVWKVEKKNSKQFYALKEMSKAKIISQRNERSVMNERRILTHLSHPFISNMSYAFQDRDNLYLVMDFLAGGDFFYHLDKRETFTEIETSIIRDETVRRILHRVHHHRAGVHPFQGHNTQRHKAGEPGVRFGRYGFSP